MYVHIHDIFFPFEYPKVWLEDGRAWNEVYLLHAFLACSTTNSRLHISIISWKPVIVMQFRLLLPLCFKKLSNPLTVPGSIWLRKS